MDLGDAKAGIILSISMLEEFFIGLQRIGVIPATFSINQANTEFTIAIGPLEYKMAKPNGSAPYNRLHIVGTVSSDILPVPLQLNTWVRLTPVLKPAVNQPIRASVLAFQYDGVDVPPAAPITEEMIDTIFETGPIANTINNMSIAILDSLINSISPIFFPDEDNLPPAAGLWASAVSLMPAAENQTETIDSLGVFVDIPGGNAVPVETVSFLKNLTEFGIAYSRNFMNTILSEHDLTGETIGGARINSFSLQMGESSIQIEGEATQDIADISFSGPIQILLIRGTNHFAVDTSGIDVDVDLPWWADLFLFLAGDGGFLTLGLVPLLGGIVLAAKGTSLGEIEGGIASAPSLVQGSVASSFEGALDQLASSLSNLGPLDTLQPVSTTESSIIENGILVVFAQVFINPFTALITSGRHSRATDRIFELGLDNGRLFNASELARIVNLGMITTPGYHAVAPYVRRDGTAVRGYMRDNPDLAKDDNLLVRFGSD
jgi:hypothetical protein